MEHMLNPPFDRKGSSSYDTLFLHERLSLEECWVHCYVLLLYDHISGFSPLSEWGPTKILGVLSVVFVTVPNPYLPRHRHI